MPLLFLLAALPADGLRAADSQRCAGAVDRALAGLSLGSDDVKSIRIIEWLNDADDYGPEILKVNAWVRLRSCSGWLVINMTAACFVRQVYTRGDCRVDGVAAY